MGQGDQASPRVLIVDDDPLVLTVLRESLADYFDVVGVDSGRAALEELGRNEFAVLLADQRMPGMTGVELASRARVVQPHMAAVLLSAHTDPRDMMGAINEGQVFRFVSKPWETGDLILTLRQAAERFRLSHDNARMRNELERRMRALEILHDVLGAAVASEATHPAAVLLARLGDVVPYDLAAVLLAPAGEGLCTLELRSRAPVSEENLLALRDECVRSFEQLAGTELDETKLRATTAVSMAAAAASTPVQSSARVPLCLENWVVGVLILQSFSANAFAAEVTHLLDLLANGTAEAVRRMRLGTGRHRQRLERALESLPCGIVLTDSDGQVLMANQASRRLLETCGPIESRFWAELGLAPEDVIAAGGDPVRRKMHIANHTVAVTLAPAQGDRSGPPGVVAALQDVTEAEETTQRSRMFASMLSHEIRTPLTSIAATIELLGQGIAGPVAPEQKGYLDIAGKACNALNGMVDDVLDLERFARGVIELDRGTVRLGDLCGELVERYAAAAADRDLQIDFTGHDACVAVPGDARRLEQVVGNLLSNAVKFAPRASRVRLDLACCERLGGWAVLGIHNGGEPIAPDDLDVLFDHFRQAKRAQADARIRGSGLGLAISRSIAQAHGGLLTVESRPTKTTFWLVLPTAPSVPPVCPERVFGPLWLAAGGISNADRLSAAGVLNRHGLDVRLLASDGAEAQALMAASGAGLVLTLGDRLPSVAASVLAVDGAEQGLAEDTLSDLAEALGVLARYRSRLLSIVPPPQAEVTGILLALGMRLVPDARESHACPLVVRSGEPADVLVDLARQLASGAERQGPVRSLMWRARGETGWDSLGVVRLQNLARFRASFGAGREAVVRQALYDELARLLRAHARDGAPWAALDEGAVFAGPKGTVRETLSELAATFPAIVRLHCRATESEKLVRAGSSEMIGLSTVLLPEDKVRYIWNQ